MKSIRSLLVIVTVSLVSACAAPRYTGTQISNDIINEKPEVVIVEDAATKQSFLNTIKKWLAKNGYNYKVAKDGSSHNLEKLTIEYVGHWKWDLALYLSKAKIEAFHQGQRIAEVEDKAPNSFNTNKFSHAEGRIEYMLEVLFGKISSADATEAIKPSKQE
ncbi:hypothetical protein AB835_10530 [Candidatus Endobugula sertula]|uniref:Lipoprotein n=1 Tax=Candidatus Endobugula sertula TaxID=62101 RepID=A0A1D2QNI9_9GAMM|nr:hypothetical protein AB835_10530 [Candidatus Endobugula sertula]